MSHFWQKHTKCKCTLTTSLPLDFVFKLKDNFNLYVPGSYNLKIIKVFDDFSSRCCCITSALMSKKPGDGFVCAYFLLNKEIMFCQKEQMEIEPQKI